MSGLNRIHCVSCGSHRVARCADRRSDKIVKVLTPVSVFRCKECGKRFHSRKRSSKIDQTLMVTRLVVPIGLVIFLVVTVGTLNLRNPFSKPQNLPISTSDVVAETGSSKASGSIDFAVRETTQSGRPPATDGNQVHTESATEPLVAVEEEVKKMLAEEQYEAIKLQPKQPVSAKLAMASQADNDKQALRSAPATSSGAFRDESWLLSLKPESFTLQIGSLATEADAKAYIVRFGFESEATYYLSTKQEQNWYPVLYGVYANRSEARKAIATLPEEVQLEKPWARPLITIQESIASR